MFVSSPLFANFKIGLSTTICAQLDRDNIHAVVDIVTKCIIAVVVIVRPTRGSDIISSDDLLLSIPRHPAPAPATEVILDLPSRANRITVITPNFMIIKCDAW